jgi:hypothetical protein
LPPARLQPIPFPDPRRFIALLDDDLSVIETGLRIAARDVPLPPDAGGGAIEALCADASGRALALRIAERIDPHGLFDALAARSWLQENLATLRAVCPALAGVAREARCLVIAGRIDPAAAAPLEPLGASAPELYQVELFQTAAGIALNLKRVIAATVDRGRAVAPAAKQTSPATGTGDPLSGIPLSSEEAAEFRRLAAEPLPRPVSRTESRAAAPRPASPAAPITASFMEN